MSASIFRRAKAVAASRAVPRAPQRPRASSFNHPRSSGWGWRPLVARTSGSATEGVYGLILATSVIAVSRAHEPLDAGWVALAVLVTALVFWLGHVYSYVLGVGVSAEQELTRAELTHALRNHWSLVEVVIPLVLVLGLGAIGVIPDRAAVVAATVVALMELAAAGAYAAIRRGAGPRGAVASAAIALALGLVVVLLNALLH
jgi:hypothetical protein